MQNWATSDTPPRHRLLCRSCVFETMVAGVCRQYVLRPTGNFCALCRAHPLDCLESVANPAPTGRVSASGVIHRAEHFHDEQLRQGAVKLFKGDVTSDGLPRSELNACIAAGKHRGLIPVLRQIAHHPSGANGLVISLIDTRFHNLADPPSLESCTRDVCAHGASFDIATVTRIAYDTASAACHLHQRGILHGDLYAHSILRDERGHALLGDFGAASFYPPTRELRSTRMQQIDVRAFGCLLEELIELCDESTGPQGGLATLTQLKPGAFQTSQKAGPCLTRWRQYWMNLRCHSCATQGHPPGETAPAELAQPD